MEETGLQKEIALYPRTDFAKQSLGNRREPAPRDPLDLSGGKTGLEEWNEEHNDVSLLGEDRLYIHSFGNPYSKDTKRIWPHLTLVDFARYLMKINKLLPWEFLLVESLAFGISRVGTCPRKRGWVSKWTPDNWGYMQHNEFGIEIHLNPDLDRKKVSKIIRQQYGIDIAPSEIYFWIWFHEVGHVFSAKTKEYFKKYAALDWLPPTTRPASPNEMLEAQKARNDLFAAKVESEREAVEFARMRFERWKKEKRGASIKRALKTLRPMLSQAGS